MKVPIRQPVSQLGYRTYIDRYIYLYSAYKSKESLGASVAKETCFQRSSERIEGKSRLPQSGWKIVSQSRTGCQETPVAKFVVCSRHEQLPGVVGMRPQRTTTSVRQKMTVVSKIRGSSTSERLMHEPRDLVVVRDSLTNWQPWALV